MDFMTESMIRHMMVMIALNAFLEQFAQAAICAAFTKYCDIDTFVHVSLDLGLEPPFLSIWHQAEKVKRHVCLFQ